MDELLEDVRRLADDVLFPRALETDAAVLVAREQLDALAELGLYGLGAPVEAGGLGITDSARANLVVETLAGGCLSTTFIWIQHHSAVRGVAASPLASIWLERLCRGQSRSGVAFSHLRRPGPAAISARADQDGWRLTGDAQWVTGMGRIDLLYTAARDPDDNVVWCLIDAVPGPGFQTEPLRTVAVNASGTVTVHFRDLAVPANRVVLVEEFAQWQARDAQGLQRNGSLALGVASRCLRLLGPSPLDAELIDMRQRLETADAATMPIARAAVADFSLHAAQRLMVSQGGRAVLMMEQAQRLAREALFLQVFGQTRAIREAQLAAAAELGARRSGVPER